MDKTWEVVKILYGKIYKLVDAELEEDLNYYRSYRVDTGKHVDNGISEILGNLLENEQIRNRIVKQIKKAILVEQKTKQRAERERDRKNRQLWKVTKGHIPCICGCGHTEHKTKDQILDGVNTYMCKDCADKYNSEKEDSAFDVLYNSGSIYDMLGIK